VGISCLGEGGFGGVYPDEGRAQSPVFCSCGYHGLIWWLSGAETTMRAVFSFSSIQPNNIRKFDFQIHYFICDLEF
jgi:hypothetical protein